MVSPIVLVPFSMAWLKGKNVFLLIFIFLCMSHFVHIKVVNETSVGHIVFNMFSLMSTVNVIVM